MVSLEHGDVLAPRWADGNGSRVGGGSGVERDEPFADELFASEEAAPELPAPALGRARAQAEPVGAATRLPTRTLG